MPISQAGALNTTALVVPDLYIQIVPPSNVTLNGVPTNDLGVVGTATWGPVGIATNFSPSQYAGLFGPVQNRLFDMGTQVAIAAQQGASNITGVRVTDGTDSKATVIILSTCLTINALWTGTFGNGIVAAVSAGALTGTFNLSISAPGANPEIYRNIPGTGNTFWLNAAAAINVGQGFGRGPSQLVSAVAGPGTTAPVIASYALIGGTDGVAAITTSTLVGVDTAPRKGMYALRKQGCSVLLLADATDTTQWTTIQTFALSEAMYAVVPFPAAAGVPAASIGANVAALQAAGIANYGISVMQGDWIFWYDQTNQLTRLVSPAAFKAGKLVALSPQESTLNKAVNGVIGSQQSGYPGAQQAQAYSTADLQALFLAGIDVITNPIPRGSVWGIRGGFNTSQIAGTTDDSYTRMTNYLATTLNAGMGIFVGRVINPGLLTEITSTLNTFFNTLLTQGLLGYFYNAAGAPQLPWSVVCNGTNNPVSRTGIGYVQADVQVNYQGINKNFILNLQGGSTVTPPQA
jgi:hypothetical protein